MSPIARTALVVVLGTGVTATLWWYASGPTPAARVPQPATAAHAAFPPGSSAVRSPGHAAASTDPADPSAQARADDRAASLRRTATRAPAPSHPASREALNPALGRSKAEREFAFAQAEATRLRQRVEDSLRLYFQAVETDAPTRERLIGLLIDSFLEGIDARQIGRAHGLSQDEMLQLALERHRRELADAQAILGEEAGRHFIDSYRAAQMVPIAEDFAARCAAAGAPIGPAVANRLAITFAVTLVSPEVLPKLTRYPDGSIVFDRIALRRAAAVLNPTQLALFERFLAERPYPQPGG